MGTFNIQLPDGTVVNDIPKGTSKAELFGKIHANNPDLFQRNAAIEPSLQNYVPTEALEKSAAGPSAPAYYGFTPSNVLSNVWQGAKGLVTGAAALGEDLASNPNWFTGPTSTMQKFVYGPSEEQTVAAGQELNKGHILPAVGHAVASAIPFAGPWAASLGEQAGRGDIGGAAGQVAGAIAVPEAVKGGQALARGAAEPLMRTGLGFTRKDFGYGREPAQAVLQETTGASPAGVSESVKTRLGDLGKAAAETYQNAGARGVRVSMEPVLRVLADEYQKAVQSRRTDLAKAIRANAERLATDPATGQIRTELTPEEMWSIKTGQGDITNWNPDTDPKIRTRIEKQVYGALKSELNRAVPEAQPLIERYSNLRPARLRADIAERAPGMAETTLGRLARPTGGSAVALYEALRGNIPGAAAALFGPEFISSPSVRIPAARALYRLGGGERLEAPVPGQALVKPVMGLLGSGPLVTPTPRDTSFVRGVPTSPPIYTGSRMLPAVTGGPFEMPPSTLEERYPTAERVPGKYAGLLDQRVQQIGPRVVEPEITPRKATKIKGQRFYLPEVEGNE